MEYVIIGIVSLLASLLSFFSGFGLGTLLMPVFAIFFPIDLAITFTAIVHFLNNIIKFLLTGKKIDKYVYIRFGLTAIPTAFIGALLLIYLSEIQKTLNLDIFGITLTIVPIKAIIGAILIVFALLDMSKSYQNLNLNRNKLIVGGMISGFFGGLSGHQGALRSAFLINSGLTKESFIATSIAIALTVDIVRMSVYASNYVVSGISVHLPVLLVAILSAFAGAVGGRILLKKITYKSIRNLVAIFLLIIGLGLITGLI